LGRFDSRYLGFVENAGSTSTEFDPSLAAVRPAYTATFNQYVRADLGYKSDESYHILGGLVGRWDWGPSGEGYPETGGALRAAMAQNPHMKVLVASGYYDLATPYAATEYTLAHLKLDPSLRRNVRVTTYEAGHMMYLHTPSLVKLKQDAARFLDESDGQ
jgi:carboxypeptidase C (cathepsin A)